MAEAEADFAERAELVVQRILRAERAGELDIRGRERRVGREGAVRRLRAGVVVRVGEARTDIRAQLIVLVQVEERAYAGAQGPAVPFDRAADARAGVTRAAAETQLGPDRN